MVQLLIGMLLGRSIGNQIGNAAIDKVKEAMKAPTAGEEGNHGESA